MNFSPNQSSRQALDFLLAGKRAEAETLAVQQLRLNPKDHTALYVLALVASYNHRHKDAEDLLRRAIASNPALTEYHYNLALTLTSLGKRDQAINALREAVKLEPGFQLAHSNLGGLLLIEGHPDQAEASLRRAVLLDPNEPSAHANLGRLMRNRGRLDDAEKEFRAAIPLAPANPQPFNMLGSCLREMGRVTEAIAAFRSALSIQPQFREAHSNLCYALHLKPGATPAQILTEHREWGRKFADPLRDQIRKHPNDPSPDRPLRIGYTSPDFRGHCQSLFTLPLFQNHDRADFRVYCYSSASHPDDITALLRATADEWRDISMLTDDQAADLIRTDAIDVLVDLTLHMTGNRLGVFAQKPAPVQFTWLGYPSTTGVSAIDYRISDPHLDPPGSDESVYVEKTLRLPHTFWCYRPFDQTPDVNDLPADSGNGVTFGCFNSFAKVNDQTLDLWASVLSRTDNSRMLLRAPAGSPRDRVKNHFAKSNVDPARVDFVDRLPQRPYMELYHRVDLCLDTTPYTGHTTTLDSLLMGVPVVTLTAQTPVSRGTASILHNVSLPDLIATDPTSFTHIAHALATNLPRLRDLRASLRTTLRASPLMDEPKFARDIESLYRQAWLTLQK